LQRVAEVAGETRFLELTIRQSTGLGMGLFIVRNLVESMGGSISVKSEPGEGATFRVKLPLA
jgi:signal transduction histidine kinase